MISEPSPHRGGITEYNEVMLMEEMDFKLDLLLGPGTNASPLLINPLCLPLLEWA